MWSRFSRRTKWDIALGVSGVIYVAFTLVWSLNAPLLSLLYVALVGHELVAGRHR